MSKQYSDGYDRPIFRIHNADGTVTKIEMSFGYKALIEFEEDITTLDIFTDGSKEDVTHFYNYEWRLFYTDEINYTERDKLKQVQNARKAGLPVELVPHRDYPWRTFYILINPEKRTFDLDEHFFGLDSTTNKGYEISFINRDPILTISKVDPNHIPVMCYEVGTKLFRGT